MFFNCHNHTMYSNLRLLDCIIKPKDLIDSAIKLGLSGIAITDHEALSAHMEVNQYAKKIRETNPDFTIALGNEIYLTETRDKGQAYYHFILIAKDAIGHKGLRELSSTAWYNSYFDRGMERVPLLKSELQDIMFRYKGHIMATTACMGGELSKTLNFWDRAVVMGDPDARRYYNEAINFIEWCQQVFGEDDFYIECAPSSTKEQIETNMLLRVAAYDTNTKMVVGTDSHYLSPETRFAHKAYLNSKGGEREVDSFYEFAYLMSEEKAKELLCESFDEVFVNEIFDYTEEMRKKIEWYSLEKTQQIPMVEVKPYASKAFCGTDWMAKRMDECPTLQKLLLSNNLQERCWINECLIALKEKGLFENINYWKRLEIEADIIAYIGNRLNTCLFAYFNTFKHYIDLFWDAGSIVGPGRGSATGFLSNYLLGITQLDPIKWELPYWRFLNKERAELPDIDIDLAPSKRPEIFQRIREERGELGLVQVATFGTEGSKSAVLTACRGYRKLDEDGIEMFPEGIDVDVAQYITSMIPQERGFLWSIKEVVYGDKEKDRKPITAFKREVDKYPGLLDIIFAIEGVVKQRGCHASGVILYNDDIYDTAAIMRTPSGDLITCYDLHMAEAAGDTKYDFLVTEVSDKIITCLNLMVEDKVVEDIGLRNLYNKYLHPEHIDTTNPDIWEHLAAGDILDVFQFNSGVGLAVAKKVKPQNPLEMTAANAMMRLMSEKGKESQQDRFARLKSLGIQAFDKEMWSYNLPSKMIAAMHKYCDTYFGCCAIQEQMMQILMDENIAKFTLAEANDARKIVAKKQMSRIPELKQKVYDRMDPKYADYIWEIAVAPQLGYAFSLNHSLPYSFVGIQTILLATQFSPIYWNTACLIVNSGAVDPELQGTTDYGKIAKALGAIQSNGIKIGLPDINKAKFGFAPDAENNQILFGLKGLLNVGDDVVESILENRPYEDFYDFMTKVNPNKQAVVSLIKSGAFDKLHDRKELMIEYLWRNCDKKKRITLQNMNGLIQRGLLPSSLALEQKTFEFNRYLKNVCKIDDGYYILDNRAVTFIDNNYPDIHLEIYDANYAMNQKMWDKVYQQQMDKVRNWMKEHQEETLYQLNKEIFKADWEKYGKGTLSAWEMEVMCFYYHDHELKDINRTRYGIHNFFDLPEEPIVEKTFKRGGVDIPIYRLHKIIGTCIAKNKNKSTVSLLTPEGVVTVKFRNEYFSLFDKQISERGVDGVKHVVEKSWFNRGSMIMLTGIRRGDEFIPKKYSSTPSHQLYKVELMKNNILKLQHERAKGEAIDE